MARIRSIHPGQWTDEQFVSCSLGARLLALALRNVADDQGVFEWKPLTLKMQLFPADAVDVVAMLGELEATDQVQAFEAAGRRYGVIRNFRQWQRPEKPKHVHPLPDALRVYAGLSRTEGAPLPDGTATGRLPASDQSATNPRPVGDQSAKVSAEEGGRRKEGEEPAPLRSAAAPAAPSPGPVDARAVLWAEGLPRLRRLTGKTDGATRALMGRLLRDTGDDCALLSRILFEAEDARPAEPVGWIEAAILSRTGQRLKPAGGHRGPVSGFGQVMRQMRAATAPPRQSPIFDGTAEEVSAA